MNFTFGIITDAQNGVNEFLPQSVQSIIDLKIPEYEIIIVGIKTQIIKNELFTSNDKIKIVDFDETIREKWITKKKNLITQFAKYDNIVYMHDYIKFDLGWYDGFKEYGDNFKVCMNKIENADGVRYRDWVLFPYFACTTYSISIESRKLWRFANIHNNESMIPYEELRFSRFQYFSGAYFIAKKDIMNEFKLDENKIWGEGEDVLWSFQVSSKYNFSMNSKSTVKLLKWKQDAFGIIRPECLSKCIEYIESNK
jgi:hypothetical protein